MPRSQRRFVSGLVCLGVIASSMLCGGCDFIDKYGRDNKITFWELFDYAKLKYDEHQASMREKEIARQEAERQKEDRRVAEQKAIDDGAKVAVQVGEPHARRVRAQ